LVFHYSCPYEQDHNQDDQPEHQGRRRPDPDQDCDAGQKQKKKEMHRTARPGQPSAYLFHFEITFSSALSSTSSSASLSPEISSFLVYFTSTGSPLGPLNSVEESRAWQ
jgi:hypothetical protein